MKNEPMLSLKILSLFLFLPLALYAQDRTALNEEIQSYITSWGGRAGVVAKNINTSETVIINGDSIFPTASIIKLPILVELFYQFNEAKLNPDTPINLTDSAKKPGSGILQFLQHGQSLKLIDIATLMIILSDNTATNYVIDQLGAEHDEKLNAVNNRMESLGLNHTKLQNKLYSFATKKKTWEAKKYGIGYTTPNDMALLLEKIAKGEAGSKENCFTMINIMREQQDMLMAPRFLPFLKDSTLWIANKTGSIDAVKNDVGIVTCSKGTYVYAILCDNSPEEGEQIDNKATLTVANISKALYNYFFRK